MRPQYTPPPARVSAIDQDSVLRRLMTYRVIDPATGCWLWSGRTNPTGYGYMGGGPRSAGNYLVHRLAAFLFLGFNLDGRSVLHRCDTPACFNPAHLFVGDQFDNMRDMTRKGRHGGTKLSPASVQIIRDMIAQDKTISEVSRTVGISRQQVRRVRDGIAWQHVA